MWRLASSAPFDRDIQLAVIDNLDVHALVFPCKHVVGGWINAETHEVLDARPTHWRDWVAEPGFRLLAKGK
jgi:hypothetical protein